MKKNKDKHERQHHAGSMKLNTPASKTGAKKSPKAPRQYPDKVGYHGTDEERDLSPEE